MEEKIISLSGGNIPYYSVGSGPLILFLHGGIATPEAYTLLLKMLSAKFSVIAPTLPGHGNAYEITADWTIEDCRVAMEEFCRAINKKPDIVMGHSFGGMVALYLASHGMGSRAIVFNPTGIPMPLSAGKYIRYLLQEAKWLLKKNSDLEYIKSTLPTAVTLFQTIVHHRRQLPWYTTKAPAFDISDHLSKIQIETDLVWGEMDKIVPINVGEKMRELIPNSRLTVLSDLGHTYPVTAPERTYDTVKGILAV